jgi:hypothetical protein
MMLFDFDSSDDAFHPKPENPNLYEWKRKNIENYLLVPPAWDKVVWNHLGSETYLLFDQEYNKTINSFFESENLILPKSTNWRSLKASIFSLVDGKKLLFENEDSLFQQLKQINQDLNLNQETIAANMQKSEIHQDITDFFSKLEALTNSQ